MEPYGLRMKIGSVRPHFIPAETANDRLRSNVQALLDWRKMNQSDLASMVGRSQPWLSKRLTGTTPFQIEDLDLLAHAFGLSPQELLCEGHGELNRRTGDERRSGTERRHTRTPAHDAADHSAWATDPKRPKRESL